MLRHLSAVAGVAALIAGHAAAQEVSVSQGEVQTFDPAYFARYNPSSVLDMVNQVPGFSVQEGDSVRGFGGAAGNVLINGERPSTKTGLNQLLQRTPASAVVRIELVTGQSATLDMRGQTKIVNIVLRETAVAQPVNFDVLTRGTQDGRIQGQVQLSTQRQFLGGQLNLSGVANNLGANGPGGGAYVDTGREKYDASGGSTEHGAGFVQNQPMVFGANFEFERDLGWGALRLNGGLNYADTASSRFFQIFTPDAGGPITGIETTRTQGEERSFTLGGDVERSFGDNISAKLITFHRRGENETDTVFSTYSGAGALGTATTNRPQSESGESILRGQVNWQASDSHAIEVAAETAYNFLESGTEIFRINGIGARTDLVLAGSDTKVEEFRSEFQISDVWTLSPAITIEPGFKFEVSRIVQDAVEREFEYPKPSITGTWRINPQQQLRVSYEREVAQLSFSDFVTSIELVNSQTTGGNPDLVPERAWAFEAQFEQRFWNGGVLTMFGNYDEVEDVQDFVPLSLSIPDGLDPGTDPDIITIDAPGNIGDGTRWLLGFRASVPMENLGLPNARLDVSLSAGGAEVIDPVTGRPREFSDEFKENWSLNFRHDFPVAKWSYGVGLSGGGPGTAYRFNELSRRSRDDVNFNVWAETSAWYGLRIRAGFDDLLAGDFSRTRVIYSGLRELSPLDRIEESHSSNGVQPFVRVSGTF